jgi:hypothetical protein
MYEQLAKHFASRKDIVIAKLETNINEIEGVEFETYTTLKFVSELDGQTCL